MKTPGRFYDGEHVTALIGNRAVLLVAQVALEYVDPTTPGTPDVHPSNIGEEGIHWARGWKTTAAKALRAVLALGRAATG